MTKEREKKEVYTLKIFDEAGKEIKTVPRCSVVACAYFDLDNNFSSYCSLWSCINSELALTSLSIHNLFDEVRAGCQDGE